MIWTFDDFLDSTGESVIEQWFAKIGVEPEAFIDRRLKAMMPMIQWPEKWVSKYKGTNLFELRITFNKVQYRPLGCYAPDHHFWLLAGAIERGKIPKSDIDAATQRRRMVLTGAARVREHDF
ncbi:MAG TPA: type II toxin-antitoxin system RelE/ParE family toxin [Candidatus Binataceae bacterium]|nr:type II toxin-antitoxin system RelE/ParE family toxin [Candidatus Binataceae bacterium]